MKAKERGQKPYASALAGLAGACTGLVLTMACSMQCGMQAKPSLAYFTTYASAKGGYELQAGTETEIQEEIDNLDKHIRIENTGEADCFVRVKVFAGSVTDISYTSESGNWQMGEGGYWYYGKILAPGEMSEELTASIQVPEGMEDRMDSFDVIVVQECVPVSYREDGTPYADWNRKIEEGKETGKETGEEDGEGARG